jgi:hypothetical protein
VARPSDVADPTLRAQLTSAEGALDAGEYLASVEHSVKAFRALIATHPEVIVLPPDFSKLSLTARPPLGARRGPWPSHFGVHMSYGDAPMLTIAKRAFSMTEAAAYFEYTLEAVMLAQRG